MLVKAVLKALPPQPANDQSCTEVADPDRWTWPALNDADIATMTARLEHFARLGLDIDAAERLADRLLARDRDHADGRHACVECANCRAGRCYSTQASTAGASKPVGDLGLMLHRCPGFAAGAGGDDLLSRIARIVDCRSISNERSFQKLPAKSFIGDGRTSEDIIAPGARNTQEVAVYASTVSEAFACPEFEDTALCRIDGYGQDGRIGNNRRMATSMFRTSCPPCASRMKHGASKSQVGACKMAHTTTTPSTGTTASNTTTPKAIVVTPEQREWLMRELEAFQDQAMVLAQQIEAMLKPHPGEDSPHYTAWRMAEVLTAHLEGGFLQMVAREVLGVQA